MITLTIQSFLNSFIITLHPYWKMGLRYIILHHFVPIEAFMKLKKEVNESLDSGYISDELQRNKFGYTPHRLPVEVYTFW